MRINNQSSTSIKQPTQDHSQSTTANKLARAAALSLPLLAQVTGARPVVAAGVGSPALAPPTAQGALNHTGRALLQANAIDPQGLTYGGGLYIGGIAQASVMTYDSSLTYMSTVVSKLQSVGESQYMMAALQASQLGIQSNLVGFEQRTPVATPAITNGFIQDADVQAAIAQTLAGALPVANPQLSQQMVFYVLPANVQSKSATRGTTSINQCAYHDMVTVNVGGETGRVPYAVIPTTDPQNHCFPQNSDPTQKMILEIIDQVTRLALNPDHSQSDTSGYTVGGQDLVDACGLTPARIRDPGTQNDVIWVPQMWAFGACIPKN